MKRRFALAVLTAGSLLIGSQASAAPILITPESEQKYLVTSNSALDAAAVCAIPGIDIAPCTLSLLYKQDFGGGETGSLPGSYSTVFTGFEDGEPTGATISYDGGPFASCPECFLVVKDGNQGNPAQYVFNLGNINGLVWNGQDDLVLSGFWDGQGVQGAISHVAIFSGAPVVTPEPATLSLLAFGFAAAGLARRRRRV